MILTFWFFDSAIFRSAACHQGAITMFGLHLWCVTSFILTLVLLI